ncbi:MAG: hypothetical protein L6Q97_11505 [Thermoanaerobaculia bacterium]|nr:hypothetical protein [Thermoanaerobaculia bacterium]
MQNPILFSTRLIALALLGHIALSWPLWHPGYRSAFPILPLFDFPFPQSGPWAALHAWLTVGVCLALLWLPNSRRVLATTIVWFIWMIAQDITRLQPWMYFYLLAFGLLFSSPPNRDHPVVQNALRWLLAAVYCWGGFNKLTPYFAEGNFPWFCEAFFWTKPFGAWPAAGYGVALAELLFAPGLLWSATRPLFRWLVPAFHLFIITALSPLGLDWNTVVIPWNVAMGGMVWVIFGPTPSPSPQGEGGLISLYTSYLKLGWKEESEIKPPSSEGERGLITSHSSYPKLGGKEERSYPKLGGKEERSYLKLGGKEERSYLKLGWKEESESKPPSPWGEGLGVGLLALAWLMPVFNIFHLWPEPLSWKMYSNTQTEATYFRESATGRGGPLQQVWDKHAYDRGRKLLLDDWAFEELHVPAWNNRHTFIQLARYLCVQNKQPDSSGLLLLSVDRWDRSAEKWETIPCAQITR